MGRGLARVFDVQLRPALQERLSVRGHVRDEKKTERPRFDEQGVAMGEHHLEFVASQAEEQIALRGDPSNFQAGDAVWWSMPSFTNNGERQLGAMEKDGGHWRGQVSILPDGALNMIATWYPVADGPDSVQFAGPLSWESPVTCPSSVGLASNAGARGEAKATVAMSHQHTLLYIYHISLTT
jgi:hypothetical protein